MNTMLFEYKLEVYIILLTNPEDVSTPKYIFPEYLFQIQENRWFM